MVINRSRFEENIASEGGMMDLIQDSTIALINSTFTRNSAKLSGGVASIDQGSQLYDSHGLFINNIAHKAGGVLYAVRSGLILNFSIFSFNQASESGGVLYFLQNLREIQFYGFYKLIHNSARTGGAIYTKESTFSLPETDVTNVNNNSSIALIVTNDSGGGIYLYRSTLILHPFGNAVNISNNTAKSNGGGMHAINSLITCTELYTRMKSWSHQNLLIFSYNSVQIRGGLYMESAAQLRVQKVKILARKTAN